MISSMNRKSSTKKLSVRISQEFPCIIEGSEAYDLVCPVSSVTGCRENPLALLKSLISDPTKSRALDMILQELPSISSPKGLTNDALFEQLQSALVGSTFLIGSVTPTVLSKSEEIAIRRSANLSSS